jgi:predicted ABC-type transport system involved in lysophospholipase L1 biosynthesis ATPase subunit
MFSACETHAEVFVVVSRLTGLEGVERLLIEIAHDSAREQLREAVDELNRVGLTDLAAIVRKHAGRARRQC